MTLQKCTAPFFMLFLAFIATPAFCSELDGWIKGDSCWVVETPSTDSKIIGIILKKAAVTVEDSKSGWLKIVFAPVRDPLTGNWVECAGCFIQKSNFTTKLPNKW